jgi:hypothetical protein
MFIESLIAAIPPACSAAATVEVTTQPVIRLIVYPFAAVSDGKRGAPPVRVMQEG